MILNTHERISMFVKSCNRGPLIAGFLCMNFNALYAMELVKLYGQG